MTVSTTISSTSVNPNLFFISPFLVGHFVQAERIAARIDVVHVLARLRILGGARVAAQPPLLLADRVFRDAAQEVELAFHRHVLALHALDEHFERRRIAGGVGLALDLAVVDRALVGVDCLADLAQRVAQLLLLAALVGELRERRGDRGEQCHDRDDDQELDEGKALHQRGTGCSCCCCCGSGTEDGGGAVGVWLMAGLGASGVGRTGATGPAPGRPTSSSVPELNSSILGPGRSTLRITRGVMRSTTSVLFTVSLLLEKSRPMSGRREAPGTFWAWRRSSSLIRPASTCVSPSRRRSVVLVLRVPTW